MAGIGGLNFQPTVFTGYDHSPIVAGFNSAVKSFTQQQEERRAQEALLKAYDSSMGAAAPAAAPALPTPAAPAAPVATGQPNAAEKQAYDFYIGKGYSPQAAAGIVGNLSAESRLSPTAVNPGDGADGSNSIGIAQWNGPRAVALKQFAAANKADPNDPAVQHAFVDQELRTTEAKTGNALKTAADPAAAALAFTGYERPAGWTPGNPAGASNADRRVAEAQRIYQTYGQGGLPAPVAPDDPAALPPNATPAQFVVPGQPNAGAQPGATPLTGPAPTGMNDQKKGLVRNLLANKATRAAGLALWKDSLEGNKDYDWRVVGEQLVRVNKRDGSASIVPGVSKPSTTSDLKEYAQAQKDGFPGTFLEYVTKVKEAGATKVNIDQKAETAFATTANTSIAKRFEKLSEEGDSGRTDMALVGQLRSLGGVVGTGGLAAAQGWLADKGVKLGANVGAVEAYSSLIDKLTPQQRVPGSGSTSNFDAGMMKSSLPGLIRTPEGNALILNTMEGLAHDKMARAVIAEKALTGEIKPADAIRQLRALPSPDLAFKNGLKELQKSGKLSASASSAAPASSQPAQAASAPVKVATPEEARRLPSGTKIILPDGSPGTVP